MKHIFRKLAVVAALAGTVSTVLAGAQSIRITPVGAHRGPYRLADVVTSVSRWASVSRSYVFDNGNDTFDTLDCTFDGICVSTYRKADNALLGATAVPMELDTFGGFYAGANYNYIVFGRENADDSDTAEVFRVVKYDKAFNRLAAAAVTNCFTYEPFEAGSLRMAEYGNILAIHTARKRYLTSDGNRHQSQLTVFVNTDTMTTLNNLGRFQENHVSHSFNQFVRFDGENFAFIDHGDAYPRGVILQKLTTDLTALAPSSMLSYERACLFEVPGTPGANCTGITIGGFECAEDNYLVAINSVDQSKVTNYTSYEIEGIDYDERDIILLVCSKDLKKNGSEPEIKQVRLTNYVGEYMLGSRPYLVKLPNDRFLVLWEEFVYNDKWATEPLKYHSILHTSLGLKYVIVNGDGTVVSDIYSAPEAHLSSDCQPVLLDNNRVVWFSVELVGEYADLAEMLYDIDLSSELITISVNGSKVTFDRVPEVINGRTMIPVRAVSEALDADVSWDEATQTVTLTKKNTTVTLAIGSNILYKNGNAVTLDEAARLSGDRTLVPLRAIAEAFDCNVEWDENANAIRIAG